MNARTALNPPSLRSLGATFAVTALVLAAAAFVAVLTPMIRNAPEHPPTITAYADGRSASIAPSQYCSMIMTDCHGDSSQPVWLPVRPGYPLQLSLPPELADAPWKLIEVYHDPAAPNRAAPNRDTTATHEKWYPKGHTAVTVEPQAGDKLRLSGVEVQLPSAVVDQLGNRSARAFWSIGVV